MSSPAKRQTRWVDVLGAIIIAAAVYFGMLDTSWLPA